MTKVLNGNIANEARKQIEQVFKDNINLTPYRMAVGSGVNHAILKRIREGKPTSDATLDKLGAWITKNGY